MNNLRTTARLITTEDPPQFPCWLWDSMSNLWQRFGAPKVILGRRFTHWHPDQPTAPTCAPGDESSSGALRPLPGCTFDASLATKSMPAENDSGTKETNSLHSLLRRLTEIGEFYMRYRASADDQCAWDADKAEVRRLLHELSCLSQHDNMIIWLAGEIQERVGWKDEWMDVPNSKLSGQTDDVDAPEWVKKEAFALLDNNADGSVTREAYNAALKVIGAACEKLRKGDSKRFDEAYANFEPLHLAVMEGLTITSLVPEWAKRAATEYCALDEGNPAITELAYIITRNAPKAIVASESELHTQTQFALGKIHLAYQRLRNAASRLVLTRRNIFSEYQVAVLASYLDELEAIAREEPPTWPSNAEKSQLTPALDAVTDTERLDWLCNRPVYMENFTREAIDEAIKAVQEGGAP